MKELETLTNLLKNFPGIGPKQAERFSYFLARAEKKYIKDLIDAIEKIVEKNKTCSKCFKIYFTNDDVCEICSDKNRKKEILIIVEKETDINTIESLMKEYVYFILGGLFSIKEDIDKNKRIKFLIERIKNEKFEEVIMAFSSNPDADYTVSVLTKYIKKINPNIKVSLLARGISTGTEIEYLDSATLKHSISKRNII